MRAGAGSSLAQPAPRTPARKPPSTPRTDSGAGRRGVRREDRARRACLRVDGVGEDTGGSLLDKLQGGGRRSGCYEQLPSPHR
ncbi:hypothetical protein [Streptomyces sp. NPDC001537]